MSAQQNPGGAALATQIRVDLAARDWTQKDLAEIVGVTRETFNKYMKGKTPMPSHVLFAVARAFGQSPSAFMKQVESRIPESERWF